MNVLDELYYFYKGFLGEKGYIGQTENGKLIPYFVIRKSESPIIIATYSIHAREYITTYLSLKQIEDFSKFGKRGTVYFAPAINIDGIEIALSKDPLYKANARGVDLNVNFNANWGKGEQNVFIKGAKDYVGECPFSESETRALRNFTLNVSPNMTLSYHSKGEEIYWYFSQNDSEKLRDYKIAKKLANVTGYSLKLTPNSAGGYKDWCIDKLRIPSFTIEVGDDSLSHPIGKEHLNEIYQKNKDVIKTLVESKWI